MRKPRFFLLFLAEVLHFFACQADKSKTLQLTATKSCEIYEFPVNYQVITLDFTANSSIIRRIMLSDNPFDFQSVCNEQTFSSCFENSSYCLILDGPKFHFSQEISVCTDRIFVHIFSDFPKSVEKSSVFLGTLATSFNFSKQCANHLQKEDELAMKCATFSQEECYSEDFCAQQCQWISCTYNSKAQKAVFQEFTLCIPANIYAEEKLCYNHYDFVNSPNKRFSFKKCGYPLNSHKLSENNGGNTGEIVVFCVIFAGLAGFLASVFYYRWRLRRKKAAPFVPPKCCPEWVYPRAEKEQRKFKEMIRNSMEYKPPVQVQMQWKTKDMGEEEEYH